MNVTIKCPVCEQELEADVTIINDSQGESPYTMQFQSLDDYTIDWPAHHTTVMKLDDDDGPNIKYMRLANHTCEQLVGEPVVQNYRIPTFDGNGTRAYEVLRYPTQDKLIERLQTAGIEAYANDEPDYD